MTVFALKIIALLAMVIDHISYVLTLAFGMNTPLLFNMRAVGRMALPIYAFLLVNGFEKTRDRKAYFKRLLSFALISQIPFSLAFTRTNYMKESHSPGFTLFLDSAQPWSILLAGFVLLVVFIALRRHKAEKELALYAAALILPLVNAGISGISFLGGTLNIFYTLAVSLALISVLDIVIHRHDGFPPAVLITAAAATAALALYILPQSDYSYRGLVLIAALYLTKSRRLAQLSVLALWSVWMYSYSLPMLTGALAACIPLGFYRDQPGKKKKFAFYLAYPLHLLILFLLALKFC